jgi:carbon monoxide dehydrogenase subunit G
MNFTNAFEISLPPERAWPFLMDIERVVPCMPGAQLTGNRDEKTFTGTISVKLGPVMLTFVCDAAFEDVDPVARAARIRAQGADSKGRGGVKSAIRFHLQPSEAGSRVLIETDLAMSGAVAQYGRGAAIIQTVANQVIAQFAANLETKIAEQHPAVSSRTDTPVAQDDVTPAAAPLGADEPTPVRQVRPMSGFAVLWAALVQTVRGWFSGKPNN